jgi:hypothetical protein
VTRGVCLRVLALVVLLAAGALHAKPVEAANVWVCTVVTTREAYVDCSGDVNVVDASTLTGAMSVNSCASSSLSVPTAAGVDGASCTDAGGFVAWIPVNAFVSGDMVWNSDADEYESLSAAGYTGGSGGGGSSAPTAFDPSMLDPSTITAYFSTGWFVVAMGWLIGKGVSLLVGFIKEI